MGAQHDRVLGHHVGTVREEGDAAEAFRFALREEIMVRHVQAGQGRVVLRRQYGFDIEFDVVRRLRDGQHAGRQLVLRRLQHFAIQAYHHQFDMFAVQFNAAAGTGRVVAHADPARHHCAGGIKIETKFDAVDQEAGRRVIFAVNRLRAVCAHRDLGGSGGKSLFYQHQPPIVAIHLRNVGFPYTPTCSVTFCNNE
ncbi:hypothetical protein D3C85_655250 [compost metagenome]